MDARGRGGEVCRTLLGGCWEISRGEGVLSDSLFFELFALDLLLLPEDAEEPEDDEEEKGNFNGPDGLGAKVISGIGGSCQVGGSLGDGVRLGGMRGWGAGGGGGVLR